MTPMDADAEQAGAADAIGAPGSVEARDSESHEVIGAAMEVHNQLGPGFLEAVYQEALAIELRLRGVPFRRETETPIESKGERLSCPYRADFVCYDSLLVELKAMKVLTAIEHAQVINYLRATAFRRALLINFGAPRLDFKRFVLTPPHLRSSASSAVP